ncbi:MAG: type II toxin-antitoxin system VapC family toxin [Chloroflexota bacterium]
MILCDTNILIEFYKGNPDVVSELQRVGLSDLAVSVITNGELLYGARDKNELARLQKHLSRLNQIALDADISDKFLELLERYALSHRLTVPDALIAATAIAHHLSLYTLNLRDFRYISELQLHKP